MISKEGFIKIVDFGTSCKGKSRDFVGTLEYMSPEMIRNMSYT
jgi:serine/threonine protein kinase